MSVNGLHIDHVLLTRFNLPTGGLEARIRASESWLTKRWELFERYCAPSVAQQSTREFTWLIYFDPESPAWLKKAVDGYAGTGLFRPIFRATVPTTALLHDLQPERRDIGGVLLTTNLDNDDGIAVDFMARVRGAVTTDERRAFYVVNGLVKGADSVYLNRDPHNAFCSVAAPWTDPRTSWDDWHLLLGRTMPVTQIGGAPGWLQVVHGANVSNRVRGRLLSPAKWEGLFPGLLDDVAEPQRRRVARDRLFDGPARRVRDMSRAALRRTALTLLGKDGMQKLKARISR